MKVLSLFDGISCGRVALERAGIPVEKYYASEIDKNAIQITQKNYPDTIQLGDVTQIDFSRFKGDIDLLIGGSPCQDLSIAKQNRQGLQGKRSGLFWRYVDALTIIKPKYFLFENVASMRGDDIEAITDAFRKLYSETTCIMINSALVSAQNRKRLYWTNIPNVCQPADKGILLKDIIGDSRRAQTASNIKDHSIHRVGGFYGQVTRWGIYETDAKAPTLTASMGMGGGHVPMIVSKPNNLDYNIRVKNKKVVEIQGIKQGLTDIKLSDGTYIIRKLTPLEIERCQTVSDNYTEYGKTADGEFVKMSATARYKALGNGWTVDVIAHIFKGIKV